MVKKFKEYVFETYGNGFFESDDIFELIGEIFRDYFIKINGEYIEIYHKPEEEPIAARALVFFRKGKTPKINMNEPFQEFRILTDEEIDVFNDDKFWLTINETLEDIPEELWY